MHRTLLFLVAVISFTAVCAQSFEYEKIAPHPRLLWPAGEEEAVRKAMADYPPLAKVHERILAESAGMLAQKPAGRVLVGRRLLGVSRLALNRIFYLSYAYRMTGEKKYAARAEEEMLAASRFTDWNPSHFLDVAEMTMALAIGYDWLHDYLKPETLRVVREAILEKGLQAATPNAWFYQTDSNWNSVCNAGLLYGALALFEEIPAKAREVIEKCMVSNPRALTAYAPDGGYPEGFHYWGYGTGFQVMLVAALESALGTDNGLSAAPGFLESARFIEYMTAPGGEYFNFSDAVNGVKCNLIMFWFARKQQDPSLLWLENQYLKDVSVQFAEERLLPCLMVFSTHQDLKGICPPSRRSWCNRGKTPVFIYRSGWNSKENSYLALKGGSPRTSHAHMDAGSFVYENGGVRWAMDLGMQNYHSLERRGIDLWNMSQDSQRWDVFRLSNQAHSTLTVNGQRHRVESRATIGRTFETKNKKGAEVDLTSLFTGNLEKAIRTVCLDKEDGLRVEDELTTGTAPAVVTWTMITPADARITGKNRMELTKDGRRMLLTVTAPTEVQMKISSNDSPHDYDEPNPGTLRVGFETQLPTRRKVLLKVTLAPVDY